MTKLRVISDTHGKLPQYLSLIDGIERSRQLGDFGFGFGTRGQANFVDKMISEMEGDHKVLRGNHDNLQECKKSKYWIPDGTVEDDIMYVGGSDSVDKMFRTPYLDWWPDEELSELELEIMIDIYSIVKPRIMLTHNVPSFLTYKFEAMNFGIRLGWFSGHKVEETTRTSEAFEKMWHIHKPEIWIGAHWHLPFDETIDGTRFVVMPELGYIDLET